MQKGQTKEEAFFKQHFYFPVVPVEHAFRREDVADVSALGVAIAQTLTAIQERSERKGVD